MPFNEVIDTLIELTMLDVVRYAWGTLAISIILIIFAKQLQNRKIQDKQLKPKQRFKEIYHSFISCVMFGVSGTVFIYVFGEPASLMNSQSPTSIYMIALQVFLISVGHDAYFYWTHRAMHHKSIFRYIHNIHHNSRTPTPFTAYSFNWSEALIQSIYFDIVFQFLPINILALVIYLNILMVRNAIGHCGVELYPNWWMKTPFRYITVVTHHDLHHDRFKYNFALHYTWWDKIGKTEAPNYEELFEEITQKSKQVSPA